MYGLALTVQAAFAGVPAFEVFVVVHPFGPVVVPAAAELKVSEGSANGMIRFEEELKLTVDPAQTAVGDAPTVTTGAATTTTDRLEVTEQPAVDRV